MWSAVFCLASALDTFSSHLVQQESAYSSETCKSLCQNFSSGKEEMSKSEFNWSCFWLLKKPKPFFLWEKTVFWKIRERELLELLIPVLHLHATPRCSAVHESALPRAGTRIPLLPVLYSFAEASRFFFVSLLIPNQHFVMKVKM